MGLKLCANFKIYFFIVYLYASFVKPLQYSSPFAEVHFEKTGFDQNLSLEAFCDVNLDKRADVVLLSLNGKL